MSNVEPKKGIFSRILSFPISVVRELTKVEWITMGDLFVKTATVVAFSAILLLYFFAADIVISEYLKLIIR